MKRSLKLFAVGIVFSSVLCFTQCRKHRTKPKPDNPYGLPNATQTGAGVFACLINGQKFIAGHRRPNFPDGAEVQDDSLYLNAPPASSSYVVIGIYVMPFLNEKKKYIIDSENVIAVLVIDSTCQGFTGRTRSFSKVGNLVITKFDTTLRIVSGTFDGLAFPIPGV